MACPNPAPVPAPDPAMTIATRPATASDAAAMSRIVCASIRDLCWADHRGDAGTIARWTANKTAQHFRRWMEDRNLRLFLAERAGVPAGVGCIAIGGEVMLIYVAPEHRFAGTGRRLLARGEDLLAALGVRSARLVSTVTAHPFYLGAGWIDADAPVVEFGMEGHPMTRSLTAPS
jgi:GNAT superfamily N-acetyltransferase